MRWRPVDPMHLADVLAYLVVLGVFIQLFPDVISETFLLSLLTAILLKLVLEVVLVIKKRIIARVQAAETTAVRIVNVLALMLVLPGSKFVVLELVAVSFRGSVYLGGFFQVTALILALMLTRGAMRRFLVR